MGKEGFISSRVKSVKTEEREGKKRERQKEEGITAGGKIKNES